VPTSKKRKKSGSRSRKRQTRRPSSAAARSGGQPKAEAKASKGQTGGRSSRWSMAQRRAKAAGTKSDRRGMGQFFKDVRMEMRKVTWPSRKDLFQSTLVVLVAVAIAGAYTGALDFIFSQIVDRLVDVLAAP